MAKIVAIDPDATARAAYESALSREGHEVHAVASAGERLDALVLEPDLVMLDLEQVDMDGNELLRRIRRERDASVLPVMVVSARNGEIDRIVAFELGADDYVEKPFHPRELCLRVRAVLRRRGETPVVAQPESFGRVRIDPDAYRVWVDDREVSLSVLEFRILIALSDRRSAVRTREDLLGAVWGAESGVSLRSVDAYVKRLRKKLGGARHCIETVRGVGYRLAAGMH